MKKEEKLELLLKMQNDPEQFTEEEIRQLLEDDECRHFYEQMVRAADAVFADGTELTEDTEGQRTQRFLRKVAAVLVGVLMLSGIAYAAIHYVGNREAQRRTERVVLASGAQSSQRGQRTQRFLSPDTTARVLPKTFENVPLKDLVEEIAAFHHLTVEVRNDEAATLRLYYPWNPKMAIGQVVEELNGFEKVQLTVRENVIVIE